MKTIDKKLYFGTEEKQYFSINISKLMKDIGFMFLLYIAFYVFVAIYTKIQVVWGRENLPYNMRVASNYLIWCMMPFVGLFSYIYAKRKNINLGIVNTVFSILLLAVLLFGLRLLLNEVFSSNLTADGYLVWITKKKAMECEFELDIILNPLNPMHAQYFMEYQALLGCLSFGFCNIVGRIKQLNKK
ncbi:MAG: hypothetical protein RR048_01350 [Oscillospiraceae bacterium]